MLDGHDATARTGDAVQLLERVRETQKDWTPEIRLSTWCCCYAVMQDRETADMA